MTLSDPALSNETLATIARRRSVRVFDGRPVAPALVNALIEAANQAPSAHNSQSWRFLVLGFERKRELAALVSARSLDFPRPTNVLLRLAARTIASAPAVIAVANTGELMRHGAKLFPIAGEQNRDFFRTMEIQGSAAAVQNLLLAATALGPDILVKGGDWPVEAIVGREVVERRGGKVVAIPFVKNRSTTAVIVKIRGAAAAAAKAR